MHRMEVQGILKVQCILKAQGILKPKAFSFVEFYSKRRVNDRVQGIQLFEGILEFLDRISKTVVRVKRVWYRYGIRT